jgi:DNA-binding GntR family transcriptional regulator
MRRAYGYVKERLLDARFPGGTLLSENDLASRLGVSRTPVRQALVLLQGEGLLELYPKRGALVVPVSASEADDVLEARLLVEPHCVRRAAGAPIGAELQKLIAEQERSQSDGGRTFAQADRAFHRTIVAAAGNPLLTRLYDQLRDRHERIAATTVARDPRRVERFIAEHRAIAEAIENGEGERAAELITTHLYGAHELARRGGPQRPPTA